MDLRKSESLATKDSKRNPNGDGGERNEEKSPLDVLRSLEGVHVAEADTEQAEKGNVMINVNNKIQKHLKGDDLARFKVLLKCYINCDLIIVFK